MCDPSAIKFTLSVNLKNGRVCQIKTITNILTIQQYKGWHGDYWMDSFINETIENYTMTTLQTLNYNDIDNITYTFEGFNFDEYTQ